MIPAAATPESTPTPGAAPLLGRVSIEDGMAVIRLPLDQIHGLRVALEPCPCRASKSTATADIRQRLSASLGRLESLRRARPPGAAAS